MSATVGQRRQDELPPRRCEAHTVAKAIAAPDLGDADVEGSVPLGKQSAAPPRDDAARHRGARRSAGAAAAARASERRADAAPPTPRSLADDKPISLNFQRAELGAVLKAFAQFTGLNIVASERVRGAVSLRLDKVPWRTAFDTLLDVNGLAMERHGNVIWVAPMADLAARERQRFEAHARAADLEPLASRTFELHYAHAEDVRRLLTGSGAQRVLSKRGAATADPRTNLLFVTDLEGRLAQIAALLASVDRPTRQVLIEARIVEGEHGFSRNLGVQALAWRPRTPTVRRKGLTRRHGRYDLRSARGRFPASTPPPPA